MSLDDLLVDTIKSFKYNHRDIMYMGTIDNFDKEMGFLTFYDLCSHNKMELDRFVIKLGSNNIKTTNKNHRYVR